jgi:hypothetical protein
VVREEVGKQVGCVRLFEDEHRDLLDRRPRDAPR